MLDEKQQEVMDFLDEKVFNPALEEARKTNNKSIISGINLTRGRMSKLPANKMVQFYWSAITGTDRSIRFAELMKEAGILRFEDNEVLEEFRVRFNSEWCRQ